jgi:hypothetical protein
LDDDGTRLWDLHDLRLHPDSVIAVEARQGSQTR